MSESNVEDRSPILEVQWRLRRASTTTMPRHRHAQVGHRGKEKLRRITSIKLSKKNSFDFSIYWDSLWHSNIQFLFPLTQFRFLKKEKQRRLLWTQAFVKSCNKSFWSLDLKRKITGKCLSLSSVSPVLLKILYNVKGFSTKTAICCRGKVNMQSVILVYVCMKKRQKYWSRKWDLKMTVVLQALKKHTAHSNAFGVSKVVWHNCNDYCTCLI